MTGETYIRIPGSGWIDLYNVYGISLEETAVSKLMTPAPNKAPVENASTLQHGKRVRRIYSDIRKEERNVSLIINITASTKADFLTKYGAFCVDILDKGFFDIKTSHVPNTIYRMTYIDCTQFSEFCMSLGKFTLTLNEPDPTNRGVTDTWEDEDE